MTHQLASEDQTRKLQEATRELVAKLDANIDTMKELLPPDLSAKYALCYWTDACLYCTQDGRNWYLVRCIV
jgi:hypothetical protein